MLRLWSAKHFEVGCLGGETGMYGLWGAVQCDVGALGCDVVLILWCCGAIYGDVRALVCDLVRYKGSRVHFCVIWALE